MLGNKTKPSKPREGEAEAGERVGWGEVREAGANEREEGEEVEGRPGPVRGSGTGR
jgi:hypothetical protein